MAGTGPQIEWYLARDGAQHGPLSDVEMRAFVQLGHLRPGDLVWRAGFADWRRCAGLKRHSALVMERASLNSAPIPL